MFKNPSLKEYPRRAPAPLLPVSEDRDLLTWLENSGRLIERDGSDQPFPQNEEEEISALMGAEEASYEDYEENDGDYDED